MQSICGSEEKILTQKKVIRVKKLPGITAKCQLERNNSYKISKRKMIWIGIR